MPSNEKKGITVKIDAELHAEVKQYLEQHGMTMAEFVTMALQDELHPKFEQEEEKSMEKMRTLAFQVPEDLFQRIKGYLQRNNMSQKQFVIGLIETELEREQNEREEQAQGEQTADEVEDEEQDMDGDMETDTNDEYDADEGLEDDRDICETAESDDPDEDATEDEEETEGYGMSMSGM